MLINNMEDVIAALDSIKSFLASKDGSFQKNPNKRDFSAPWPEGARVLKDILASEKWPEAVPEGLICRDTEEDKSDRALGIVELLGVDCRGKKFLDFGCGEGHVVRAAKDEGATASCGYDVTKTGSLSWQQPDSFFLTTSMVDLDQHKPFDIILLHDVLDHADDPVGVLKQCRDLSHEKTKIIVRCHSFMSRHGGHLYKQVNKAWIQLVFSDEELASMGLDLSEMPKQRVFYPINTYHSWFQSAGLKVHHENTLVGEVEEFFRGDLKNEIVHNFNSQAKSQVAELPEWQMSQHFNDFTLIL